MTKDGKRATVLWEKSNDIDGDISAHDSKTKIEAIDFLILGEEHKHTNGIFNDNVNFDDPVAI